MMPQPVPMVGAGYPMQQQPMMGQGMPMAMQAPQPQQALMPGTIIMSPDGRPMVVGPNGAL